MYARTRNNIYTFEHLKKGYSNDTCFGRPKIDLK